MATLSRRTMLRGALGGVSVALGLPLLEAMIGSKDASAAPAPPIFGVFYWANGTPWHAGHGAEQAGPPDLWTPQGNGTNYVASELLAPLDAHRPTIITGLTPHTDWPATPPGQEDGHMRGFMVAMTGDRVNPDGFDHDSHTLTALRPTLDQYVAKHPNFYGGSLPRYQSLVMGVSRARFHEYGHWNAVSYNGPNSLNPPVLDSSQLYSLLFSVPSDLPRLGRRAALLDAVTGDAKSLRGRLGSTDKARLDAHLEHISAVQHRMQATGAECGDPGAPSASENLHEKTAIMADLLARALACDMTRSFSFMLTSPATTHVFSNLGVADDMHTVCHAGSWEAIRAVTHYQMEAFGIFLDKLAATPDPYGTTVLDRSVVFGTSEYGEGFKHSVAEMPVIIAGGASGKLKAGQHIREPNGNFSKAHLTMLRALGLPDDKFGWNGGETSEVFGQILNG